ncbi:hypothetical protein [Gorillibacterium sp. CAU 1737]|uniref:hypothetical protein n=1 Tax=Gorillibacterium sp. CAU 1737 TaxID=3140362 RepID=UPI003261BA5B
MYKQSETKEKYIGFPMKMNAYAHEGLFIMQKDEDAFLLYFILGKLSQNYWTWGSLETTVVTLSKQLRIKNKESDNRNEIKRLLLVLHDRGWIKITFDEESFKYDTLLTISMVDLDSPHVMESVGSDNYNHLGWVKVKQEMYDACNGNARHFRAMIYTEWRFFRGQENQGKYRTSLDEWEKVLDISHVTAVKLFEKLDELKLLDKHRGAMYKDASGKVKRETNQYSVVSEDERQERKEEAKYDQYSFAHQHNIDVQAGVAQLDGIDPKCEGTNVYKTGKKDLLGKKEYWIWMVTEYVDTRLHLEKRFNAFKKARPDLYANVEREGKAYIKEKDERKSRKPLPTYDPTWADYDEDAGKPTFAEAKAKKMAREAEQEAQNRFNAMLDDDTPSQEEEEYALPF